MPRPTPRSLLKALVVLSLCATATAAHSPAGRFDCGPEPVPASSAVAGRLLILPGVGNTEFHLAGFVERARRQLPRFDVEVRTWGVPFMTIHNLRAHDRNLATAASIAAQIAEWRRAHPEEPFYLLGYSGGGGMAMLVTAALPQDIAIDRLILVAPAIAPDYVLESVMAHVREFAVNYSSERDLQVGWGTRTFGTIDRRHTASAGAVGFTQAHARVLEHRWSRAEEPFGHFGNHMAYLNERWQTAKLLPALDPSLGLVEITARVALTCKET